MCLAPGFISIVSAPQQTLAPALDQLRVGPCPSPNNGSSTPDRSQKADQRSALCQRRRRQTSTPRLEGSGNRDRRHFVEQIQHGGSGRANRTARKEADQYKTMLIRGTARRCGCSERPQAECDRATSSVCWNTRCLRSSKRGLVYAPSRGEGRELRKATTQQDLSAEIAVGCGQRSR